MAPYTINHSHPLHKSFLLEVMQMFLSPKLDKLFFLKKIINNVACSIHKHSATEVFSTSHSESLCNCTNITEQSQKQQEQSNHFSGRFSRSTLPSTRKVATFLENCLCSFKLTSSKTATKKKAV